MATERGNFTLVRQLLECGASTRDLDEDGLTPLHVAAKLGLNEVCAILIDHGANLEEADQDGNTPLILATKGCHSSTVSILIKSGASLKHRNKDGHTPLHVAAKLGLTEVCVALLDRGADLEEADQEGNTPLLLATKESQSNTISSLLERGAKKDACDKQGLTPLHVGQKRVVLLGESGSGKSSIGNCLLSLKSGSGFEESYRTKSCTKETTEIQGKRIQNGTEQTFTIVDTPGMNDSNNNDQENIGNIVEFLHNREYVNSFLLVRNGKNCRMHHSFKSMLSRFELSFGKEFWQNVVIGISHIDYTEEEELRMGIEEWKQEMNSTFPASKEAPLETVVLNIKKKNEEAFKDNVKRFWELAFGMKRFNCKNVSTVKSENYDKEDRIKQLEMENKQLQMLNTQHPARQTYPPVVVWKLGSDYGKGLLISTDKL